MRQRIAPPVPRDLTVLTCGGEKIKERRKVRERGETKKDFKAGGSLRVIIDGLS